MPRVTMVIAANLRQTCCGEAQILRASATLASGAPVGWGAAGDRGIPPRWLADGSAQKLVKNARVPEERSEGRAGPLLARLLLQLIKYLKGGDDKWHSSEEAETRLLG